MRLDRCSCQKDIKVEWSHVATLFAVQHLHSNAQVCKVHDM